MSKRKLLWALVTVIVLAGFAFFVLTHSGVTNPSARHISNGSIFRLGKVKYAKGPYTYSGIRTTGWRGGLAALLPERLQIPLLVEGLTTSIGDYGTNLIVFTVEEGPTASHQINDLRLVVFNELGDSFEDDAFGGDSMSYDSKYRVILHYNLLHAFPRRGKTLRLRFYDRGKTNTTFIAEFVVPNPVARKYPTWNAEALPASKSDGDLSATLVNLKTGLSKNDINKPASGNELAVTEATLRLVESGRETNAWRPKSVEISDATGNIWTPVNAINRHVGDMDMLSFDGALWPDESAWKLRFEFSRIADFEPGEVITFKDITVPGATQVIELENSTNIGGTKLRLIAISGKNADQPGNLKWITIKKHTNISVETDPAPVGYELTLLKIIDESGREVAVADELGQGGVGGVYAFNPPKGAKRLSFTFALHKSRFVEFLVKPHDARAN